jgi:cobalt-zinc-cadmium efflux system membrane fusion protein
MIIRQIKMWAYVCSVGVLALGMSGCGKEERSTGHACEDDCEEDAAAAVGDMTVAQVLSAKCPHGPTIECAECRYEVGVVKVLPALLKQTGGSGAGLVATAQVARHKMTTAMSITGEIRLNENAAVHVSPRIPGIIRAVNVDIGSEVRKDDVLFTVDSVELAQAMSDYEKNRALADLSGKTFRREKRLYEQKVGAENDMIEAQMRFEEYQTARKASEQRLHVLGLSESEIATLSPTNHGSLSGALDVRAPMGGTVIEKHAVIGELVEPGKDVMVLANLDTLWMWGGLYERDLGLFLRRPIGGGFPVEITVPAFPDTVFRGTLNHIGSVIDEATRTLPVRTVIDNRDRRLRPGMFCQGRILVHTDEEVLAVPQMALLSDEGVEFVFTHMKDDYFLRVNVTKGREFAEGVEILKGLTVGQTIVTDGAFALKSDVLHAKMGAGCAD